MHWLNHRRLFIWVLSALTETAVTMPLVMFTYWVSGDPNWPDALPGAWLFLVAFGGAAAWESGSADSSRESPQARMIAMIVGLLVIYLLAFEALPITMRPESRLSVNIAIAVLPPAAYLWYQGASSGAIGIEYGRVFTRFTRQTLAMVASLLVLVATGIAEDVRVQVLLVWSLFLLFGAGATLIIVARERDLRLKQAKHGESGEGAEVLSPTAVALVGGLMFATLASSYLLSVQRLTAALGALGTIVTSPFLWLVDVAMLIFIRWIMIVMTVLTWVANLIRRELPDPEQEPGDFGPGELPDGEGLLEPGALVDWSNYLRVALILSFIMVMLVLAYRLVRNRKVDVDGGEEVRIALGFWQELLSDLKGLFRRKTSEQSAVVVETRPDSDDPRDPRALFRWLQQWGKTMGRSRRLTETPTSYGLRLSQRHPTAEPAIKEVTDLYNQARYGSKPPADDQITKAAEVLKQLQSSQEE